MTNIHNGDQSVDLLGGCGDKGQYEKRVTFDEEAGVALPDPSCIVEGQGPFHGQSLMQRNMSEGEILGYQNEYGESIMTRQTEYTVDSEDEQTNLIDIGGPHQSQGHLLGGNAGEYSIPDPSQNLYNEYVENDFVGDTAGGVQIIEEPFDGNYDNNEIDPDSWHPEMDAERIRRSRSPERSVSPYVRSDSYGDADSDMISYPSEAVGGASDRESVIPVSEDIGTPDFMPDLISQDSQQLSSEETESLDSRSETDTPRRRRIPRPKTKIPLELPPWDDNVVVPKLPRMKPTLIGKQADLPPPSPPQSLPRLQRPRTAPARHTVKGYLKYLPHFISSVLSLFHHYLL